MAEESKEQVPRNLAILQDAQSRLYGGDDDGTLDEITPESDIRNPERRIWVVTTAALPWMTGTAVNPLLRALYLTRGRPKEFVTLMIPWMEDAESRRKIYGKDRIFETSAEQEEWIRHFCRTRAFCADEEENLRIRFYSAVYHEAFGSIFPTQDICSLISAEEADVAILEEPEHLTWTRVPPPVAETKVEPTDEINNVKEQLGWAHKFRHVVGILHTNYDAYMKDYAVGTSIIAAPAIHMLSSTVVRAYCRRVIRLSAVLPSLAPHMEVTCNVHGVRAEFQQEPQNQPASDTSYAPVYFVGKLIWAKGFDRVLGLQDLYRKKTGHYFDIDIYGGGKEERAIKRAFYGRSGKPPGDDVGPEPEAEPSDYDLSADAIFSQRASLRRQISEPSYAAAEALSIEVIRSLRNSSYNIRESGGVKDDGGVESSQTHEGNPFDIIGDLSGQSIFTGVSVSQAVYRLGGSVVKAGLDMAFSEADDEEEQEKSRNEQKDTDADKKSVKKKPFFFDPPQSRYEWRKTPIPARFLGVKDHALLRDIKDHKIFLNMSTTEVSTLYISIVFLWIPVLLISRLFRSFVQQLLKRWRWGNLLSFLTIVSRGAHDLENI
jgi:hypothetical protein